MIDVIKYWMFGIAAVAITIIFEYPIIRLSFGKQKNIVANVALINSITNIALNMIVMTILDIRYVLIPEMIIVLVEMYMYKWCYKALSNKRVFITSLLANTVSFIIGSYILNKVELYFNV